LVSVASAQELPGKILGYKLYKTHIGVSAPVDGPATVNGSDASVRLGDVEAVDIGLTGATFAVNAEISSIERSGKVDFLMFRDFRVNDLPVVIERYDHPFTFSKHQPVKLPEPIRLTVSITDLPGAVYKEMLASPADLPVKGTVLVFGRFKRMGIEFKRVIPVIVDIRVRNPLHR
jgi:hypothetical protein